MARRRKMLQRHRARVGQLRCDPNTTSLADARDWMRQHVVRYGAVCPCCEQFAKVYRRKLNSQMARAMIAIYRSTQPGEWIDVPALLVALAADPRWHLSTVVRGGDWAKARWFGLIEQQQTIDDSVGPKSKQRFKLSRLYRLTPMGRQFVERAIRVPSVVVIYNDRPLRLDTSEAVDIVDALGRHFDYSELMRA